MVEIDPVTLLAAGTVVVGIVSLVSCLRGGKKPERKTTSSEKEAAAPAPVPVAAPKGKKKTKSKSKSKSKSGSATAAVESGSDAEPTPAPAVAAPEVAAEKEEDERADDFTEDTFVMTEADKKAKKAKETQEQKASRLERQKQPKEVKKTADETVFFSESTTAASSAGNRYTEYSLNQTSPAYDGWAVVEDKRKLKKKAEANSDLDDIPPLMAASAPSAPAPAAPTAPVAMVPEEPVTPPVPVDLVTKELTVEARKLGLLIGQKGVTKIGLQTATGTEIAMPKVEKDFTGPVTVAVTGPAEGVDRAVHALNELCTKGYCNLLASPDFHEGYVEVKPKFLPDIIGKGGFCIRAIQAHTGVKVSTPSDYTKVLPSGETIVPSKVKIVLAGAKDKVALARSLILDLCKYYYTPVTHPGVTHLEMDISPHYYNYVIGSKGSEIKHIQANYKVTVYIPNAETANQNLLIVGEASNLQNAEKHILRLIEKVDERAKAEAEGIALGESAKAKYAAAGTAPPTSATGAATTDAAAPGTRAPRNANRGERGGRQPRAEKEAPAADASAPRGPKDPNAADAPDEEWTNEYAPRRAPINLGALLPATAKFASAPAPVSPAANVADAAL